jgi:methylated-DNA-[protein]-cysteine S-methyltransferase
MVTKFQNKVYNILKKVPKGKVTTYGSIAKVLGKKSYRAVGNALNKNPYSFTKKGNVPCHRVIKSNGELSGFASGVKKKIELLKHEGIQIEKGKIDLDKYEFKRLS